MIDYYFSGAMIRATQIFVNAAVWIVIGCFIASIFRTMLGEAKTRALFGGETRFGILIGWIAGMLLPVCSLGVIPIVRELHRSGVKGGTIVAFGLTAPLFNPMSFLYGLTMSDPIAILVFTFAALVIVSMLGWIWNLCFPEASPIEKDNFKATHGLRRSVALVDNTCRSLTSPAAIYILLGIFFSVLITVAVPKGAMQAEAEPDKVYAPALMAMFMTPVYATPVQAMSQIGSMIQHGNSIGAAFSLLILGAGTNIGLLIWFVVAFGFKRSMSFIALLLAITIGLAYAIDKPLYPKGVHPTGHTHAFDVYTHPYGASQLANQSVTLASAAGDTAEFWKENDFGGTLILAGLLLGGICFRFAGRFFDLIGWYADGRQSESRFDRVVPGWVLGIVATVGLILASIGGAYLYYPAPDQVIQDLYALNTECVISAKTKDWEAVRKWVPVCDDLSRRLEVGIYIREGKVSEFCSTNAQIYREKLDEMRDSIDLQQPNETIELAKEVAAAYLRLSRSIKSR